MIKFRQFIHPSNTGSDVLAVRLAMRAMGHTKLARHGRLADPQWVNTLKTIQRHYKLKPDGIYGPTTHGHIAPHMSAYARLLYRHARIRRPVWNLGAVAAAKQLLAYYNSGKLRDDSGRDKAQIEATAQGKPVYGAGGWVHLDRRVLDALIWWIEQGHTVGTFAICSDHPYDGTHGHAGGHAVDISSIDGTSVAAFSTGARTHTLALAKALHHTPALIHPWQEICDGYGERHDSEISAQTIPGAYFYGATTMSQHRNHIHLGYY